MNMIINRDPLRKPMMIGLSLILIWLIISTFNDRSYLTLLDNLAANFGDQLFPNLIIHLALPFFAISHGFWGMLAVFIVVFLLWGFKFKIPAIWVLITSLTGNIFVMIVNIIFRSHTTMLVASATFEATLLSGFCLAIIIPEIKNVFFRGIANIGLIFFIIFVFVRSIVSANQSLSSN